MSRGLPSELLTGWVCCGRRGREGKHGKREDRGERGDSGGRVLVGIDLTLRDDGDMVLDGLREGSEEAATPDTASLDRARAGSASRIEGGTLRLSMSSGSAFTK